MVEAPATLSLAEFTMHRSLPVVAICVATILSSVALGAEPYNYATNTIYIYVCSNNVQFEEAANDVVQMGSHELRFVDKLPAHVDGYFIYLGDKLTEDLIGDCANGNVRATEFMMSAKSTFDAGILKDDVAARMIDPRLIYITSFQNPIISPGFFVVVCDTNKNAECPEIAADYVLDAINDLTFHKE